MHEKELFAIVCALHKWHADLLGVPFTVLTDHRMLECFQTQKHLSQRQAQWTELLQQFDFDIVYVKGGDNAAADALSHTNFAEVQQEIDMWCMMPFDYLDELEIPVCSVLSPDEGFPFMMVKELTHVTTDVVAPVLQISQTDELHDAIINGYTNNPWCIKAQSTTMDGLEKQGKLLYYKDRLVIPHTGNFPHTFASLAHNSLGHFGFDKTYIYSDVGYLLLARYVDISGTIIHTQL